MLIFFFNDTATTEIYTLSLHDALPIFRPRAITALIGPSGCGKSTFLRSINRLNDVILGVRHSGSIRSEEHTSELQSRQYLVCRLLLEKKKKLNKLHLYLITPKQLHTLF